MICWWKAQIASHMPSRSNISRKAFFAGEDRQPAPTSDGGLHGFPFTSQGTCSHTRLRVHLCKYCLWNQNEKLQLWTYIAITEPGHFKSTCNYLQTKHYLSRERNDNKNRTLSSAARTSLPRKASLQEKPPTLSCTPSAHTFFSLIFRLQTTTGFPVPLDLISLPPVPIHFYMRIGWIDPCTHVSALILF